MGFFFSNTGRRKRKGEITAEAGELTKRTGPEARLLASVTYKREVSERHTN
jgi:hypothetical protein